MKMKNNQFCHLHLHNEFSYLDGYGKAKNYIKKAKEIGYNYIGITNHGNIDGVIQWQQECHKQKINPIVGCEAYIVPDRHIKTKEDRGHITLLVKDESGWSSLCGLLTEANLTGFYNRPRVDYSMLLNTDLSGLIIMTACAGSFLNLPGADELLSQLYSKYPNNIYFEIMPHDIPAQHDIHNKIKGLSKSFPDIPFVATNDCHYIQEDEWEAQEMLLAINSKAKWSDTKRWTFGFKGLHLRTADEMVEAFQKQGDWSEYIVKQAMQNTIKIARKCFQFRIPKQEMSLPLLATMEEGEDDLLLQKYCEDGYKKIFKTDKWEKEYRDRYLQELKLIQGKNFSRYFLIVKDVIDWARSNDIVVGPGRGSSGGSLVAFLMNITQGIDPIKFKLSFSRFLSEDRQNLPDIDIDFEKRYRGKVVKYLEETYGEYNTCGISTDMKMQSRAAIRDVGRVMEIPLKDVGSFATSIWAGESNSAIQSSVNGTKEGKDFAKKYPHALKLMLKMEGQTRGNSAHAAAVIISKEDLSKSNRCILIKRNNRIVCNWSMEDSEYVGLMKLDVLGLSTLSVLSHIKKLINGQQQPLEFLDIPLDDSKTFALLSAGNTSGIFQLSGRSCTELCNRMGIHSFEDIIAVNALARPGPANSGMTDEYVMRKHGKKWKAMHPIYEEITKYTYGIIVYQEQVMQVISKVAGLSESIADKIRKIIAKKSSPEALLPYWEQFLQGCKKTKTLSQKEAEKFWEELKKHASYSFNRSHSVAYGLIGYWTAYLKMHYKKEFYAASLTFGEWSETNHGKNKNSLIDEIKNNGYKVMPPKRKYSDAVEWQFHNDILYTPFVEIIGVGENGAKKCLIPQKQTKLKGFFGGNYGAVKESKNKLDQYLNELMVDDEDTLPSKKILSQYLPHLKYN